MFTDTVGDITGNIYYFEEGDRGLVHRVRGEKVLLPHRTSDFTSGFVQITSFHEKENVVFVEGVNITPEKLALDKNILLELTLRYPMFSWVGVFDFKGFPVYKVVKLYADWFVVIDGKITPLHDLYVQRGLSFHNRMASDSILESERLKEIQYSMYGNPSVLWEMREFSSDFINTALRDYDFVSASDASGFFYDVFGAFNQLPYSLFGAGFKPQEYINTSNYPEENQILCIRTEKLLFQELSFADKLKCIEFVRTHNEKAIVFWKERLRRLGRMGVPVDIISKLLGEFKQTGFWSK